jgi:hypothetical protein
MRDEEAETDYFIFSAPLEPDVPLGQVPNVVPAPSRYPGRTLTQIARILAETPPGTFTPPPNDWRGLHRTHERLQKGGPLHVLALGDSIVNDMMRSGWLAQLQQKHPRTQIKQTVYVRGGGGCQHYAAEDRVSRYILPRRPDLVLIGGISQQGVEPIREVVRHLRAGLPEVEILLCTGAFGSADCRDPEQLAASRHCGAEQMRGMHALAADTDCAFLDLARPWAEYLISSQKHPHVFYRDRIHANEFGEQVLAKVLLSFFAQ